MANIKITDLTAYTDPATTDVVPIVDVGNDTTKKVSVGEVVGKISGDVDVATDGTSSIAAGVIVNADVNASAAIAGTKIDPDFGSQTIETTGVFSAAGGAAATPSIAFTGDLNTGIYSPGADQVAISTNGTGRLFIDSSGNVGIGTSSPAAGIDVSSGAARAGRFIRNDAAPSSDTYALEIDSSAQTGNLNSSGALKVTVNSGTAAVIDGNGRLGIGTTSPNRLLTANGIVGVQATGTEYLRLYGQGGSAVIDSISSKDLILDANGASNSLVFYQGGGEAARIDSSKRLLVGTSSAFGANYLQIQGDQSFGSAGVGAISLRRGSDLGSMGVNSTLGRLEFGFVDGGVGAQITALCDAASAGTNDYPGRLVFSVTPDGSAAPTEAMRIKNSRIINIANTPVYADNAAAKTGGLVDGDVYRTSTGDLKIVYT